MSHGEARERLLDAAIEYVAHEGMTDLSLRRLADELGTSHRMLCHHFGSKEGLWVAIVREVERQQLAAAAGMAPADETSLEDALWAWWVHISDPSLWPNERLFFEVYAQALYGRSPAVELLDGVVESWVEPAAQSVAALGVPADEARAFARLAVAVTRGLLLDLLATGDRSAVDEAMRQWIALTAARYARRPAKRSVVSKR